MQGREYYTLSGAWSSDSELTSTAFRAWPHTSKQKDRATSLSWTVKLSIALVMLAS